MVDWTEKSGHADSWASKTPHAGTWQLSHEALPFILGNELLLAYTASGDFWTFPGKWHALHTSEDSFGMFTTTSDNYRVITATASPVTVATYSGSYAVLQ